MYKVIIHPDAQEDKKNIYNYLLEITWNNYFSKEIIKNFYEKYLYLQLFPLMYPKTYKNYRTIEFKSYKIYYKINENSKIITIYRIFWTKENFKNYI